MSTAALTCVVTLTPVSTLVFGGFSAASAAAAYTFALYNVWGRRVAGYPGQRHGGQHVPTTWSSQICPDMPALFSVSPGLALAAASSVTAACRSHVAASQAVTLLSGATATSVLQVVDVNNFSRSTCGQVTAPACVSTLRIS